MKKSFRNLANLITLSRMVGVAFIFSVTPFENTFWQVWAGAIFVLIALTDLLDGWIARRFNAVTDVGKILDPLADKILVLVFLPLLFMRVITAFPVFIILTREFSIMALRVFSAKQGLIIAANRWGKLKTAITLPVCGILMGRVVVPATKTIPLFLQPFDYLRVWILSWPAWVVSLFIWSMVLITVLSFFEYFFTFLKQRILKKVKGHQAKAKQKMMAVIPNLITLSNMLCGIIAVFLCLKLELVLASGFILLGILLDAFDGRLARKLGVLSEMGAKLDSKADFMTFGIAPSVFIFSYLNTYSQTWVQILGFVLAVLFYGSVHFRLNRFDKKGGHSDYFEGLPSPIGAALVITAFSSSFLGSLYVFTGIVVLSAFLMASTFPYPHNQISSQLIFYRFLTIPTLIFWIGVILQLFGIPLGFYLPDILFFLISTYLLSPWLAKNKKA